MILGLYLPLKYLLNFWYKKIYINRLTDVIGNKRGNDNKIVKMNEGPFVERFSR